MVDAANMLGWVDPWTLGFVLIGSLVIAATRTRKGEIGAAFAALRPLFRADPAADATAAMRAVVRVEVIAEAKSIVYVDRLATTAPFLREAVHRLADASSSTAYRAWANESLAERETRHKRVIAFWTMLADSAPAMGMIATVLGLVRMFAHMDDPRAIGGPMASALVATLFGLILANIIAGPIAARLERLSEDERAWQAKVFDHFTALAHSDLDHPEALQRRLRQRYGG